MVNAKLETGKKKKKQRTKKEFREFLEDMKSEVICEFPIYCILYLS